MPQIGDLLWRLVLESVISLSSSAKLVLTHVPEYAEEGKAEHDDLHA